MTTKSVVFCAIFILPCIFGQDQDLTVNTTLGKVKGLLAFDGSYAMYLGIPYAKVVEHNPFGPSNPHPEYEETFEANDDSHFCPQIEEINGTLAGDLDCLRLNIFVPPTASSSSKLPVFVWIYGGRFELGAYGSYIYGPKFLVRHDIILVTINYRLGPFGFMCLDLPEVPGNQGFKDQLMGLRWLHDNIEAFGGDPDKITLGGNSAGAMSVDYHLLRKNEGPKLIDKAILQSGTSFSPRSPEPVKDAPILIADHLGFLTDDIHEAIAYLAPIDPLVIIQAVNDLGINDFRPCVEKEFDGVEAFVIEEPISMKVLPTVKDMPIIVGFNNDESYLAFVVLGFNYSVHDVLAGAFDTEQEDFNGMEDVVKHFFFGDEVLNDDNVQMGVDLSSDMSFIYPSIRSLERFVASDAEKVYLYMFSYNGGRNFAQQRNNISMGGAWHADELGYLFDIEYMEEPSAEDQLIVDRMTTMWANFIKSGNPTPVPSELLPETWVPITKGSPRHYLNINQVMSMDTSPYNERMSFWDLFFAANEHSQLLLANTSSGSGTSSNVIRWF